jgi:hypothetical protein
MADPAFAEMEAEAESIIPRVSFRQSRADKLNEETPGQTNQAETSPLLGPPVLLDDIEKKWYNTPSVRVQGYEIIDILGILVITRLFVDSVEFWVNNSSKDQFLFIFGM